jgi:hypothetical protein
MQHVLCMTEMRKIKIWELVSCALPGSVHTIFWNSLQLPCCTTYAFPHFLPAHCSICPLPFTCWLKCALWLDLYSKLPSQPCLSLVYSPLKYPPGLYSYFHLALLFRLTVNFSFYYLVLCHSIISLLGLHHIIHHTKISGHIWKIYLFVNYIPIGSYFYNTTDSFIVFSRHLGIVPSGS